MIIKCELCFALISRSIFLIWSCVHTSLRARARVGPVVARSTSDRKVRVSNPSLAYRQEFLRAQKMNLRGSTTRLRCILVP